MAISKENFANFTNEKTPEVLASLNFNTICFFTEDASAASEVYKKYTKIDEVAADFGTSSDTYEILSQVFNQSPSFITAGDGYLVIAQKPIALTTPLARLTEAIDSKECPFFGNFFYQIAMDTPTILEIASFNQSKQKRLFCVGYFTAADLEPGASPAEIAELGYNYTRAFYYLSNDNVAVNKFIAAFLGRALSVIWQGGQTLTMSLKELIGITPDNSITDILLEKVNANGLEVFANVENSFGAIYSGSGNEGYWDNAYNRVVFKDDVDTEIFNKFKGTNNKIPGTSDGVAKLNSALIKSCEKGVANGFIGKGEWQMEILPAGVDEEHFRSAIKAAGYFIHNKAQTPAQRKNREAGRTDLYINEAGAFHSAKGSIFTDIA